MNRLSVLTSAIALAVTTTANAGTVITCQVQAIDPSSEAGLLTMYIEEERVRIEFENEEQRQVMIYDSDDEKLWLIDDYSSAYREVKPKDLKKFRNEMEDQLAWVEGQMREMPREAREAWQAEAKQDLTRMANIARPRKDDKYTYEAEDKDLAVRNWNAQQYSAYYDDELDSKYAVAAWEEVGITREDVEILIELHDRFGSVAGNLDFVTMWANADVAGFPVRMTSIDSGEKMDVTEMRAITQKDLDPHLFELPRGLDKKELFVDSSGTGAAVHFFGGATSRVYNTPTAQVFCDKPVHNN